MKRQAGFGPQWGQHVHEYVGEGIYTNQARPQPAQAPEVPAQSDAFDWGQFQPDLPYQWAPEENQWYFSPEQPAGLGPIGGSGAWPPPEFKGGGGDGGGGGGKGGGGGGGGSTQPSTWPLGAQHVNPPGGTPLNRNLDALRQIMKALGIGNLGALAGGGMPGVTPIVPPDFTQAAINAGRRAANTAESQRAQEAAATGSAGSSPLAYQQAMTEQKFQEFAGEAGARYAAMQFEAARQAQQLQAQQQFALWQQQQSAWANILRMLPILLQFANQGG